MALALVVSFTLWRGRTALVHANFFKQDMSKAGPLAPLTVGGVAHALVGTVWMIGIAIVLSVPLGLVCAVYLDQTRSRPARFVRTIVEAMTALPTILAGLFIYASWILTLGFEESGLAAALALSIMMLPYMIRTSDLVLRLVPNSLREASGALGAPRWRTVWHVVLPTARSGLATAVILAIARSIGEASPVLLTAGFTTYLNANPIHGPMVSLPLVALKLVQSGVPNNIARGFASAAFLLLVIVALFILARIIGGWGPGHMSSRQKRRVATRLGTRRPPARGCRSVGSGPVKTALRTRNAPSRLLALVLFTLVVVFTMIVATGGRATADTSSYVPVTGAGSTWSENALDQWIADVQQYGMRVNYSGTGSTAGRQAFLNGTVDFAASDIPFQTKPDDGSAPENPVAGSYAYMPITAGGTVFMYNLMINGQRVTNLRLSGQNIAKIFTGEITNWSNPAIAADNPGLRLPNEPIVPVVRSDGAGDSFEFSQWMISQYPSTWNAFCSASGRAPACGPTSFYPDRDRHDRAVR